MSSSYKGMLSDSTKTLSFSPSKLCHLFLTHFENTVIFTDYLSN